MSTTNPGALSCPAPFHGMRICPSCYSLFGECEKPTPQRCRCDRPHDDVTWPNHDFNLAVELCRCCGTELLQSGSRWSVWFCRECKEQVGLLNGRFGRCVVPIGRHSFHAGYMLNADDLERPGEIVAFAEGMTGLFGAMKILEEWAGVVVRRNVDELGLESSADGICLVSYLRSLQSDPPSKEDRFREMTEYLAQVSGR